MVVPGTGHVIGPPVSFSNSRVGPAGAGQPYDREPFVPAGCAEALGELIRGGATDAKHGRRLLDREEVGQPFFV